MRTKPGTPNRSGNRLEVEQAFAYMTAHRAHYLDEIVELVRIPSIGTNPDYQEDTIRAAQWLADSMEDAKLENVSVIPTARQPLVYGDWLHAGDDRPTILIYGHYDVQPVEPIEEWRTSPFEPTIIDDYLYGRGTSDDKCQLYIHIKSIEAYMKTAGRLPLNVKCLFEGEEEYGGESIEAFIEKEAHFLRSDVAVISDTAMANPEQPVIVSGTRGICYAMLDIYGPDRDLHSGSFGGAIDNPINVLGHILADLKDINGKILIPGFYDHVRDLSPEDRRNLESNPINNAQVLRMTGAPQVWGEPDRLLVERLSTRPTLDVNGVIGGYTGEGEKTIIPAHVHAKISMRLVPDQDGQDIFNKFKTFVEQISPPSVKVKATLSHIGASSRVDLDSPAMDAAVSAYKAVFDTDPIFIREGGSIPVVAGIKKRLNIDTIMMGFGLPDDNIHSPNERFYLPNFQRGIETMIRFMDEYGSID
jgi:acetylornithine deacetylase/succinyl-diaminopimelate desuccinylase-like protein